MVSINFMNRDEPNFIWKNLNATIDMGCIIESEIIEITPNQRYETIQVQGRSGELHETFGDYDSYKFPIKDVSIPYDRLAEVKKWLRGRAHLITHNDDEKYRDAICMMSEPIEFENEWGEFYKFDLTFQCQPFKREIRESPNEFSKGSFVFYDSGDEIAKPYFEIEATAGNFSIQIGNDQLTILNALRGTVTIDTEFGKIMQAGVPLFSKGTWPRIQPGQNKLITAGNLTTGRMLKRSVWL